MRIEPVRTSGAAYEQRELQELKTNGCVLAKSWCYDLHPYIYVNENQPKHQPKIYQKSMKNKQNQPKHQPKIYQKSMKNKRKSTKNQPKIDEKSNKIQPKILF